MTGQVHKRPKDDIRTARMEQRTRPHIKQAIQEAAALLGQDETTFVVSAAYSKAQETLHAHQVSVLSPEAHRAFAAALERPARRNEALAELFADHDRRVVSRD